jgi:GT2 family glycosyltransferase
MTAEIAVIIVNYGTADLAIEAVESILAQGNRGHKVEVHLIDNASPGDDAVRLAEAHRVRRWCESVFLYAETVNHGFGRGNNVALKRLAARSAPPDKVFLLNPDARLENEAVAILADFLDDHPDAGAAGAAILLPDGTPVTSAFRFPTLAGEFEKTANLGPLSRLLSRSRIPMRADLPTQPVDWVAGAAVMFKFRALEEARFFDPAYFLYFEEVDLMLRLARLGWKTWFVPDAQIVHHEGAATGVATATGRKQRPPYVYESWRHYYLTHHGRSYALATALAGILGGTLNLGISCLRGREPWLPLNHAADVTRYVIRPMLGRNSVPSGGSEPLQEERR